MMQIAGYILSGGLNKRMGGEKKAFLKLKNQTFLTHIIEAMSVFPTTYLSVDQYEPYLTTGLPLIKDIYTKVGPLGAIYTGHITCKEDALFVVACDMPYITKEIVQNLVDVFQEKKTTVLVKSGKQLHPLLAIYPKTIVPKMKQMLDEQNYKMMDLLACIDYEVVELPPFSKITWNINTKQEYEQMLKKEQMISVEDAISILTNYTPLFHNVQEVSLMDGLGKVLAEDVIAQYAQPPFPRSPLDGFAVNAEDVVNATSTSPVTLTIVGEIFAGQMYEKTLEKGCAVRIMTGAPIPDGANTVIRQESTTYDKQFVQIFESAKAYANYCPAGEDYEVGQTILTKGTYLDGINIGVLASMGYDKVFVYQTPNIGVISTGDELAIPGNPLQKGQIYDANRYLIQARLLELGISSTFSIHCNDDVKEMVSLMKEKAEDTQLIITTGGVSVGTKDIMHEVVEQLHAKKLFWKVDVKPGSPTLAAVYHNTLFICLSGNPFGAAVNFELLVRPILAQLMKNPIWKTKQKQAILKGSFPKESKRRRFVRGYYQDGVVTFKDTKHSSGILSTFIGCNCLIDIEKGNQGLKEGDRVWIHLL